MLALDLFRSTAHVHESHQPTDLTGRYSIRNQKKDYENKVGRQGRRQGRETLGESPPTCPALPCPAARPAYTPACLPACIPAYIELPYLPTPVPPSLPPSRVRASLAVCLTVTCAPTCLCQVHALPFGAEPQRLPRFLEFDKKALMYHAW